MFTELTKLSLWPISRYNHRGTRTSEARRRHPDQSMKRARAKTAHSLHQSAPSQEDLRVRRPRPDCRTIHPNDLLFYKKKRDSTFLGQCNGNVIGWEWGWWWWGVGVGVVVVGGGGVGWGCVKWVTSTNTIKYIFKRRMHPQNLKYLNLTLPCVSLRCEIHIQCLEMWPLMCFSSFEYFRYCQVKIYTIWNSSPCYPF